MNGKNRCRILKQIRQKIADENDIPYVTRECTFRGECRGTCPKCEAELKYLEQQLEKRRRLGKSVAVTAVAAGMTASLTACAPVTAVVESLLIKSQPQPAPRIEVLEGEIELSGDVPCVIDDTGDVSDIVGNMTYMDEYGQIQSGEPGDGNE